MEKIQALNLRQLKLIQVLSEVHSVKLAASVLNITQSSATKSLQKAEILFDAELFHRTSKGLVPTQAGQAVIKHANIIGQTVIRASQEVRAIESGGRTELRIGSPIGGSLIASQKAILRHSQEYPDIVISIKDAPSVQLYSLLMDRQIDCIIGRQMQDKDVPGVIFQPIYKEIFCICARPDNPLVSMPDIELADLSNSMWILPHIGMRSRQALEVSFNDVGVMAPSRFIEIAGQPGKQLMLDSDAVGLWTYQSVRAEYLRGELAIIKIALPRTITDIGISLLEAGPQSPAFSEFCQHVHEAGAEIQARQDEWHELFDLPLQI